MSWLRCLSVLSDLPFFNDQSPAKIKKPRILVAGYGWASHEFVKNIDRRTFDIHVISERDRRLNQNQMIGQLAASYTASLVPITVDKCLSIDKQKRVVTGLTGAEYPYDYLVVATGSEVNDFGIPGVRTFCRMCKTGEDIEEIGAAVRNSNLRKEAIILGAGPTGIELACALRPYCEPVRIIEAAPALLPGFSDTFRERVVAHLAHKGIQLHFNEAITSVERDAVVTKRGRFPSSSLLVWTCGIRPVAFARNLSQDDERIYVIGDSCKNKGPPTAQNAAQQGRYLASLFNSGFTLPPYVFKELGRCLDLGDGFMIEVFGIVMFVPKLDFERLIWLTGEF